VENDNTLNIEGFLAEVMIMNIDSVKNL